MDLWLLIKSEKKIDFQIKMILWCIFNGIQKQYIDLILKLSWEIYSWEISIASVQVCFWLYPDNIFDWNTGIGCKICFLFWPLECCFFVSPSPVDCPFHAQYTIVISSPFGPSYYLVIFKVGNISSEKLTYLHMILENLMVTR